VGCLFSGNSSGALGPGGAAACRYDAAPVFENCIFVDNYGCAGAAVYCTEATATLIGCRFEGNRADCGGGALNTYEADPILENCEFVGNEALYGGAAAVLCAPGPVFTTCTFRDNIAGDLGGGAIYCSNGSPVLDGCTLAGNAGVVGSGLACCYESLPTIGHTIIAGGLQSEAVYCLGPADPTLSCCDIHGNAGGDWEPYVGDQLGTQGNICEDPLFCDAAAGDLTLSADSPCAPENNPQCGLVGAWPVGCGGLSAISPPAPGGSGLRLRLQPNPFRIETTLALDEPEAGTAEALCVRVHDPSGRLIRTLYDTAWSGQALRIAWDGTDETRQPVATGMYLLDVRYGHTHEQRRVLCLR
jgi:predicted outer membrane repeat protein